MPLKFSLDKHRSIGPAARLHDALRHEERTELSSGSGMIGVHDRGRGCGRANDPSFRARTSSGWLSGADAVMDDLA